MAPRQQHGCKRFASLAACAALACGSVLQAQTFHYYDANGHSQGKVVCSERACEVFAGATLIGKVTVEGTAYHDDGERAGHIAGYGENWRPANFWLRPDLPVNSRSSADPEGWLVPLNEAIASDAVGGDLDRTQVRALQAAAIAYGAQHSFVAASDPGMQQRAASPHDPNPGFNTLPALLVHDSEHISYVMLHGIWVLAIGKASNANQVTVWWPGADQIETAVASLSEVVETLNAAGLSLSADEAPQIQHLPLRVSATDSLNAKPATVCVSGDPRLRSIVQDAMRSWRGMQFTCSDAGNDLVLTVAPTGRWIAVMPLEEGTAPIHFHGPQTAFEAIAVLRDRAGQELWWAKKEAWTGRGDQTHVAQQIARSFRKFYSTYVPPQRAASLTKPGSGSAP